MESSKRKRENESACGVQRNMKSSRRNPHDLESSYGVPRPLNLGRTIFLSHSGRDKNFVRFLHEKLCQQYHDPRFVFFDEKNLPTAEPINMTNILIEARGCELGILVLSEDFFTHTPNPMLELEALTDNEVRLLPLFYKISVDEFNEKRHQNVWETRWKQWPKVNGEKVVKWQHALELVNVHSGLEFCKLATNETDYIKKIVKAVTSTICPAISFSEKGIYGKHRLCEIVNNMYTKCESMRTFDGCTQVVSRFASDGHEEDSGDMLDLVGIYGFAGLGKSTLCRSLCDFYFAEFHGKVCWVDLGSITSDQTSSQARGLNAFFIRMRHILSRLVGPLKGVDSLTVPEVQSLLRNQISLSGAPVFLAIDNILLNQESLDEVHFYLSCKFLKGSKIFITARSKKILEYVTSMVTRFSVVIDHIPTLKLKEATDIFVNESSNLQILGEKAEVEKCVEMCIIHQDGLFNEFWYHPLMLKSLAASLRYDEIYNKDWRSKVRELQLDAILDKTNIWRTVFNMFDVTYVPLSEEVQKVFLDLTLFYRTFAKSHVPWGAIYAWIQGFHSHLDNRRVDEILLLLEHLSFINLKHNNDDIFSQIQIHDLMMDFAKDKLLQGAAGFYRHCLLLEDDAHLQNNPTLRLLLPNAMSAGKCLSCPPKNVRTVSISGCGKTEELDLRNLEGVEVLHLVDNPGLQKVLLSPTTIASVRSFIVKVPHGTTSSLRCIMDEGWSTPSSTASQGQLVWVELEGNVILDITRRKKKSWWSYLQSSDNSSTAASVFDLKSWPCFRNLQYLSLSFCPLIQSINLTAFTQLKNLSLYNLLSLREIHGLERLTNLEELSINYCDKLVVLTIPANLSLSSHIFRCRSLERVSLHYTVTYPGADCKYGRLNIYDCDALRSVDGIAKYMGDFWYVGKHKSTGEGCILQEEIRELLGSSKFTATVTSLVRRGYSLRGLKVQDVQHVGLLVSALNTHCKAQARRLDWLEIICRKDGDCGCDKNVPHFGPGPVLETEKFVYQCPQVRDLSSLTQLGHRIWSLDLEGCCSVEVWPDFGPMTCLYCLNLSHTSLKELPAELLRLPSLSELEIEGCLELPVEEMIKAITCKDLGYNCECGGCLGYNCGCGSGSLQSLRLDLWNDKRDRGSVVDVLDSEWPHLVTLFHKQRQYLNDVFRGAQLRCLILVMYELWFGDGEASYGGSDSEGHPSPTMKKMKRLLCSETFMSLVFNSETKLEIACYGTWEAVALIGSASIGCINASLNEDLKDKIVNFVQDALIKLPQCFEGFNHDCYFNLKVRVHEAVCKMARALSVAEELDVQVDYSTSPWLAEEREI